MGVGTDGGGNRWGCMAGGFNLPANTKVSLKSRILKL